MRVAVVVEGGDPAGKRKDTSRRCREAFSALCTFPGRATPQIILGYGRRGAYDTFNNRRRAAESDERFLLLVDSETPVATSRKNLDPWPHLAARDAWKKTAPPEDVHLMATCTETWVVADAAATADVFGVKASKTAAAWPTTGDQCLEARSRQDLAKLLYSKARPKGESTFEALAQCRRSEIVRRCPVWGARFFARLNVLLD